MIRRLLEDHDARADERQRQAQLETKRSIEAATAQHVQPLNAAIAQESRTRAQTILEVQQQIQGLQEEFQTFTSQPRQLPPRDEGRHDEIVIGGFGSKSKDGAIRMVEKILDGKEGNPQILKERVSHAPKVVPVKFSSQEYAEAFVRNHAGRKEFTHKFEGFWCNVSRTPEERAAFIRELAPLYKVKRAACEVMQLEGFQIVVSKVDKKVFYVKGFELLLIAEFLPSGVMKWQPIVQKEVQDAYDLMMTSK